MDGPRDYHTKLVKHMKSLTYGSLEKKMIVVKLFTEQK